MIENEWPIFLNFYGSPSCWHPALVSKLFVLPLQFPWAINHDMTGRHWENCIWPRYRIPNPWILPSYKFPPQGTQEDKYREEKCNRHFIPWELSSNINLHLQFPKSKAGQCEGLSRIKAILSSSSPGPIAMKRESRSTENHVKAKTSQRVSICPCLVVNSRTFLEQVNSWTYNSGLPSAYVLRNKERK